MDPIYRACPSCGDEFLNHAARCPECDQPLGFSSGASSEAEPTLPPATELVCIAQGDPWHLRSVAEHLQAHQVSCRIDRYPPGENLADQTGTTVGGSAGHDVYVPASTAFGARRSCGHARRLVSLPRFAVEILIPALAAI